MPRLSVIHRQARISLLLIPLVLCGGESSAAPAAKSAWTLMIYQDLDNSLEAPGIENLKEMLKVGGGEQVQVIVLCDRSAKSEPKDQYSDEDVSTVKNWSGTRILRLDGGRIIQVDNWGDTNVADPQTLRKFLETTATAYPADRYGLIISDHGTGWSEFCVDESHGERALSLHDLRTALEPFVKDHSKLEFVGLDACLMGSFETAQALAPVAHTMVGSEELAPARGWNYDAMLKTLNGKPSATGYDLGRAIIDAYTIHFRETTDPLAQFSSLGCTLSMINLDSFGPLQDAVSELADRCTDSLRKGHAGWAKVARARADSEEYGIVDPSEEGGDEEMHDLIQMATILEGCGEPSIAQAAQTVEATAKKAITYLMRGPLRPHAGGLSIYFPTDGIELKDPLAGRYLGSTCARDARWVNFLSLYSVAIADLSGEPKLLPVKKSGDVATLNQPVTLVDKTTDDDIARAHFVILAHDGSDLLMVGRMPQRLQPDGVMGQQFRGLWYMLYDGKKALTCPLTSFEPLNDQHTSFLATAPMQLRRSGGAWQEVSMTFHVQTDGQMPRGRLIYTFADTKQGPRYVALRQGDEIRPIYTKVTAEGEVGTWISDKPGSWLHLEDPHDFTLAWGQIGKGAYQVGFEIVNLAGQSDLQTAELTLQ